MNLSILFLYLIVPLIVAILAVLIKGEKGRRLLIISGACVISVLAIAVLFINPQAQPEHGSWAVESVNWLVLISGLALSGFIVFKSFIEKRYLVAVLALFEGLAMAVFEVFFKHGMRVDRPFLLDDFSRIMIVIIGIIGSVIAVYAIGYMNEFHQHYKDVKDRRTMMFFVIFAFLAAMFGIVISNDLTWTYFFWEVTTLSSFLLIRYTEGDEAVKNAYKALFYNLIGGLAFIAALYVLYFQMQTVELDRMLDIQHFDKSLVLIPAILLTFAGMTKSAQLPFSKWLLGAMVAPTPVSALLHSSTMVKAGVFLVLKMSPILMGTAAGLTVAFIGMATFFFTSLLAVSQRNAKRVLAYSTIGNLGLVVACGGIGTYESVWAGILLIIFHAVAKGLLFITVGTVEHKIGSRDIEHMDGLINRLPVLTTLLIIGVAGMFLAPFGMLISKWAVLKAFVDTHPILAVILVFGSAATLFFWSKWIGKLVAVCRDMKRGGEETISRDEWTSLYTMAGLTIGACALFPLISHFMIETYIASIYKHAVTLGSGNIIIMLTMLGLSAVLPIGLVYYSRARKNAKFVDPYMGGANVPGTYQYTGSMGKVYPSQLKNYYLNDYFSEEKLLPVGIAVSGVLFVILSGVMIVWRG